jgi:hypothetical protein
MTDRIHALTVVLDRDYRDDDVQRITEAIEMVRGVASVETHVSDFDDHAARHRVRHELAATVYDVFRALMDGKRIQIVEKEPT